MKLKRVFPHIVFVFLVGGFVFAQSSLINNKVTVLRDAAKVARVIDGDTIKVLINNKEDTVRLIGIDSPEILDERKPIKCFGKEASNKAKEILNGKTVILEFDPTQGNRDEYGRLLRYVFFNGLNFNKFMISEGYAHEYTFKGKIYKYQSKFRNAERKAQENKKGLWADGICNL